MGNWTLLRNPCIGESEMEAAQTFGAQSTFVLPAPGRPGSFIFMADQWNPEDLSASRFCFTAPPVRHPPRQYTGISETDSRYLSTGLVADQYTHHVAAM